MTGKDTYGHGDGNTHYALLSFSGDLDGEHPDEELRGRGPFFEFIAAGPEEFCWQALTSWTAEHPLALWQEAEVVARHESVIRPPQTGDEVQS